MNCSCTNRIICIFIFTDTQCLDFCIELETGWENQSGHVSTMSQIFGDVADVALAMQARLRCVAKPEVFMCLMGGTRRVLAVRGVPKTINICIILHHFASFCIILHHFASFEKDLLCLAQCLARCLAAFGCAFSLHPSTGDPESALAFIQGLYPHTHATGRPCFKQNHISIVIFKIYLRMYFRNLPDVIEDA